MAVKDFAKFVVMGKIAIVIARLGAPAFAGRAFALQNDGVDRFGRAVQIGNLAARRRAGCGGEPLRDIDLALRARVSVIFSAK